MHDKSITKENTPPPFVRRAGLVPGVLSKENRRVKLLTVLLAHSQWSALNPESRLFYFASLIKQARVLGRLLVVFPTYEWLKKHTAEHSISTQTKQFVCSHLHKCKTPLRALHLWRWGKSNPRPRVAVDVLLQCVAKL